MKKFKFSNEFLAAFSSEELKENSLLAEINLKDLDKKTSLEIQIILDKIFRKYYYVQSHYMRKKRSDIINFLLTNRLVFEQAKNYDKFLIMIFIHLVLLETHTEVVDKIIEMLNKHYRIDFSTYETDFAKCCFLQYCGAYYYTHSQNNLAIKFLEHAGKGRPDNNKDFSATNNFLLTNAYITGGQLKDALNASQKAIQDAQETNNYMRFLFCQANQARLYSAMGCFEEALSIYQNCLVGADVVDKTYQRNINESIATVHMYLKDYQKAIDSIHSIEEQTLTNNSCYICALCYFQLGDKNKAQEWVNLGKKVKFSQKTADLFIELVQIMLDGNEIKIVKHLKEMKEYEEKGRNYSTHNFITRLLIKQLATMGKYEEAYTYTEILFKL